MLILSPGNKLFKSTSYHCFSRPLSAYCEGVIKEFVIDRNTRHNRG